MRFPKIAKRDK